MVNYQITPNTQLFIDVTFTLIGIAIAVMGTLQEAFKFEQRAAGVIELANRARSHSRVFMSKIAIQETSEKLLEIIDEENDSLSELYSDAAKQDINLVATSNNVQYVQSVTKNSKH